MRELQPDVRLYTPLFGRFELRARANDDPHTMVALWMIGYEDEPDRSAEICVCEICVCEIFGRDVSQGTPATRLRSRRWARRRRPPSVDAQWIQGRDAGLRVGRSGRTAGVSAESPLR